MRASILIPGGGALAAATAGGHFELVSEFEVLPGGHVNPHRHPTHEFYFVRSGTGRMTVGEHSWEIVPGDLVTIPSEAVHSLEPVGDEAIRCFCFAVGDKGAGPVDYGADAVPATPAGDDGAADAAPAALPPLDVRSPRAIEPAMEHRGTVAVWWTVPPRALRAATLGGRLGDVASVEVGGGAHAVPAADALRLYAVLDGGGAVTAGGERRELSADDVVLVAPGVDHSLDGPLSLLSVRYEAAA